MLIKKGALKNFTNHTGKAPMLKSPLNKTTSPQACIFIKKRLQYQRPLPPLPRETFKNIPIYKTPSTMAASGERQNII